MIRTLLVVLTLLLAIGPSAASAQDLNTITIPPPDQHQGRRERHELLMSHGIDPTPETLLRFLDQGFAITSLPQGLPSEPILKSQVINAAIVELGLMKNEAAVPVLSKIALQERVAGVDSVIRRDIESEPVEMMEQTRQKLTRFFSLNAIVALGWIGDERGRGAVLDTMRRESGTAFVTKGAIALGQMGSNAGLPSVMLLASDSKSLDSVAAFQTIWVLTGRNYGYHQWVSLAKRRKIVEDARVWFEAEGSQEPVYRHEINRRLQTPLKWDTTEDGSLRNLLRASRDVNDYDRRYFARERLNSMVQGRFTELRLIAEDEMEDVDIRMAAIQYLSAVDPRKARGIVDDLEDDENPPVATLSKSLEDDIKEAIRAEKDKK